MAPRLVLICLAGVLTACASSGARRPPPEEPVDASPPSRVRVQHVLVAFRDAPGFAPGRLPPSARQRTRDEARRLAEALLERARTGVDFAELMAGSGDLGSGEHSIVNHREPPTEGAVPRMSLARGFGDVAFSLRVGEVGLVEYHPENSPFGWHVVKRIE